MKKILNECKNSAENPDIYNEDVNIDMFSFDELMKKSVEELEAMLADNSLFPLDETADTDDIERICDVIEKKKKTQARITKSQSQKAWKLFLKKYITPEPETALVEVEIITTKKRKKNTLIKVFTTLAAAAIVILVVKIPKSAPQIPATDIPIIDSIELPIDCDCNWIPDDFQLEATGTITYTDDSQKTYSIYTSGEKIFFVSSLTDYSDDTDSPRKNQLDLFDVFTHSKTDDSNINNGDELTETFNIGQTKLIIYGDVTEKVIDKLAYAITVHNLM
jgi:hypothetical protein